MLQVLACAAAALATPAFSQVDPNKLVDDFERTNRKFEGFRRSGAKGVCATGEFVGSAQGRALSVASAFSGTPVPVIARFPVGGANPKATENSRSQRNLSLQFDLPGGESWQMGNISSPVFGAGSPEQLLGRLEPLAPDPVTKKTDPDKAKAFADANPKVLLQAMHFASLPVPASLASVNDWGVHGFGFVDARGRKQFGKWIFEPVDGTQGLTDEEAKAKVGDFLFDDLRKRGRRPGRLRLQPAACRAGRHDRQRGRAAARWPQEGHARAADIKSVAPDATGPCLTITFIPTILPKGVEPTADPMRAGRAAPYVIGLAQRLGEGPKQ